MGRGFKWFTIILTAALLSGCSSVTIFHRNADGVVTKVESKGKVRTEYERLADGTEKIMQDSKQEPLLKIQMPDVQATKIGG